jgi:hypothetical protein
VLNVGSGLIYAAIIVMWAVYFIPRWLRRHEELSESRSVEKFDHAMRILSRRDPTPDQRYVVMPPRPDAPAHQPRGRTPVPAAPPRPRPGRAPAEARLDESTSDPGRRAGTIAVRRRRVLAGLVLLTLAVAAAAPLTPLPWWAPAALLVVTLGDLVHLRVQERRRSRLTRTREAVRRRTHSRLRRLDSAERIVEARRILGEQRAAAEAARVEQEWADHEAARLEADRAAADLAGWQPTPVPLPTYVTKPRAPRVGRPLERTDAGAWTEAPGGGGQEPFDQTLEDGAPSGPPAAAVASDAARAAAFAELDAILDGRRAVND